jgi:hypothetical protein
MWEVAIIRVSNRVAGLWNDSEKCEHLMNVRKVIFIRAIGDWEGESGLIHWEVTIGEKTAYQRLQIHHGHPCLIPLFQPIFSDLV